MIPGQTELPKNLNNWNGQESAVISYSDISGFAPLLPYLISFSYWYRWSCWNFCCSRDSGHKVDGVFVNNEVFRIPPKVFGQIGACCVANPFLPTHSILKKRNIWRIQSKKFKMSSDLTKNLRLLLCGYFRFPLKNFIHTPAFTTIRSQLKQPGITFSLIIGRAMHFLICTLPIPLWPNCWILRLCLCYL